MAIRKHSKISDAIMFNYLYTCPSCGATFTSKKEVKKKKCPECGTIMVLSSATAED